MEGGDRQTQDLISQDRLFFDRLHRLIADVLSEHVIVKYVSIIRFV